jgi:polyhydroxyalkanoate synthesis repressor PhaR
VATVVIKKYGNRRLYDTSDSRYVTLEELTAKIRSGSDLRVVDAQTGEDLTQATLTQIVLETGNAAKFLPVQLLTQMIRLSDDALAEFFSRYVTGALDLYMQAKRGVQSIASYNPLAQIPMAATDALARMWMGSPFGAPYQQYSGYAAPPPYPIQSSPPPDEEAEEAASRKRAPSEPGTGGDSRADDVAAMRKELDELKAALRESLPKKKKRRP